MAPFDAPGKPPIDLHKHTSLIYGEGIFSAEARKKFPMRAKTADGILRYAAYPIAGIIDSAVGGSDPPTAAVFASLEEAIGKTGADVLILGSAPEGGELPAGWRDNILRATENSMHIVSGMHYALKKDAEIYETAKKNGSILWDVRHDQAHTDIPIASAKAYEVKKPIVLTVGTDAALGKMTVAYELIRAAKAAGKNARLIPTGQTAVMIEGWGYSIDALPADFMAGAVERMVLGSAEQYDMLVVEGQGSLYHPAYANTAISLIHGAVPTHMILVHRPARKQSVGSRLVKLPNISEAIDHYEKSVLPQYRNAKVAAIALNSAGLSEDGYVLEKARITKETNLPVGDVLREKEFSSKLYDAIT